MAWLRENWISAIDDGVVSRGYMAQVAGTDVYHVRLVGIVGDLPLTMHMVTRVMQREAFEVLSSETRKFCQGRPKWINTVPI